jgi:hypothetical protein
MATVAGVEISKPDQALFPGDGQGPVTKPDLAGYYSASPRSCWVASRLSRGSSEGPLGTAHDASTSPTWIRRSKCSVDASCR